MTRLARWIVGGTVSVTSIAAVTAPALWAPAALAQEAAAALPSAEEVINRFIEATGGRAAYEKLTNRMSRGTMEVASMGMKGSMNVLQAAPNRMLVEIEIAGVGKTASGFNGEVAWENSQMMGPRILGADEVAMMRRTATFNPELNWKELYESVTVVGMEDVEGKPAYKLDFKTKEGETITQFYDKESGLLARSTMSAKTQMGDVAVVTKIAEWKEFDGIKMPVRSEQSMMGMTQVITVESVEHNMDLQGDPFALPEEVSKLVEKKGE